MEVVALESTEAATGPRRRTVVRLCVGVLALMLAVGVASWRYYQVGLFDDYRAGYASVQVAPLDQRQALTAGTVQPCMDAVAAAYPDDDLDGPRSDAWRAFSSGCNMKLAGLPFDSVWHLHNWLGDGQDHD